MSSAIISRGVTFQQLNNNHLRINATIQSLIKVH